MIALLKRIRAGDDGTFGSLLLKDGDREIAFCTGELPWRGNAVGKSCIPAGEYQAKLTRSQRFNKDLYEVMGVKGRSGIRIHVGNYCGDVTKGKRSDVEGCILVGMAHSFDSGQRVVARSALALRALHQFTAGRDFTLAIVDG